MSCWKLDSYRCLLIAPFKPAAEQHRKVGQVARNVLVIDSSTSLLGAVHRETTPQIIARASETSHCAIDALSSIVTYP